MFKIIDRVLGLFLDKEGQPDFEYKAVEMDKFIAPGVSTLDACYVKTSPTKKDFKPGYYARLSNVYGYLVVLSRLSSLLAQRKGAVTISVDSDLSVIDCVQVCVTGAGKYNEMRCFRGKTLSEVLAEACEELEMDKKSQP